MRGLILLLALLSTVAQATDYYWDAGYGPYPGVGSSPRAAYLDRCNKHPSMPSLGMCNQAQYTLTKSSDTVWIARSYFANGSFNEQSPIIRKGDGCPPSTTFDPATGECKGDPCLPTVGQVIFHGHTFRNLAADGNPDIDPPVSICKDLCQYTHTFESFSSKRKGDEIEGSFKYKGNGVSCTVSTTDPSGFTQPPSKPPMSPQPTSFDNKQCNAWVTSGDTSSRSCLSTSGFHQPGNISCSRVSGVYTCTAAVPVPQSNNTQSQQQTNVTLNNDGSKTTTTNTTTTSTNCKGMTKCTTDTKNETQTSGTGADGSPGNTSSTCTGSGCGSGSGSGSGDDKDDEKEEEEEEGLPGPTRTLAQGEEGSFDDAHTHWDQQIEDAHNILQNKVDHYANQFSGVFDLNLGGAGGSLPCEQVNVTIGTTTKNLDMCLERFSEPLGYVRFAILLAATALAGLIILR
jgi:hypothetical protein